MPVKPLTARAFPDTIRTSLEQSARDRRDQLLALPPTTGHDLVSAAHRRSVERILDEVHAALARLEAGTFGECHSCGGPIPLAELEQRPWSTRCAWCAR
jgi:DnaK suppressor protein